MAQDIVMKSGAIDATDEQGPVDEKLALPASGRLKRDKLASEPVQEIEIAPAYGSMEKAAKLAFMEEKIDVMVHESTDPNAEQIVETWVNGIAQRFVRGQVQTVRRKYVNVLACAKGTGIATREARDNNGDRTTVIVKHTALKYPFSVVRDENPRGALWLKSALAQNY